MGIPCIGKQYICWHLVKKLFMIWTMRWRGQVGSPISSAVFRPEAWMASINDTLSCQNSSVIGVPGLRPQSGLLGRKEHTAAGNMQAITAASKDIMISCWCFECTRYKDLIIISWMYSSNNTLPVLPVLRVSADCCHSTYSSSTSLITASIYLHML